MRGALFYAGVCEVWLCRLLGSFEGSRCLAPTARFVGLGTYLEKKSQIIVLKAI